MSPPDRGTQTRWTGTPGAIQDTDADSVVNRGRDAIPSSGDRLGKVPKYLGLMNPYYLKAKAPEAQRQTSTSNIVWDDA
jgi:hypothetical protein